MCALLGVGAVSNLVEGLSTNQWKARFEDTVEELEDVRREAKALRGQIEAQHDQISQYNQRLLEQEEKHAAALEREVARVVNNYAADENIERFYPSDEFIRMHDNRARNLGMPGIADSPALADRGPRRVTDIDLIEVISANYQQCHRWRRKWVGWMSWWAEIERAERERAVDTALP